MHIGLVMSVCLSICLHDSTQEPRDEIWYGCYAIEAHPKLVPFNFLQLVIPAWRANELVRWD
jgi:hypothetical protein